MPKKFIFSFTDLSTGMETFPVSGPPSDKPFVDRREFGGRFNVRENSQRLANYRYLEIQLMEMLGGRSHLTPQLAFKATFGYRVYDHAQSADMLGERMEQLRSGGESQEPATDEFAKLCEFIWAPSFTFVRGGAEQPSTANSRIIGE